MERTVAEWETIISFLEDKDEELHREFVHFDSPFNYGEDATEEDKANQRVAENARDKGFLVRALLIDAEIERSKAFHRENLV